ncbi:MAG: hypothetical protein JWO52_4539 [Gammaproteobacteria bacterium]|nr:hypothetical protein [Gammaproteobacteria bacterium]
MKLYKQLAAHLTVLSAKARSSPETASPLCKTRICPWPAAQLRPGMDGGERAGHQDPGGHRAIIAVAEGYAYA